MKIYRLAQPPLALFMIFLILTIITCTALILLGMTVVTRNIDTLFPGIVFGGLVTFWWMSVLLIPYRIEFIGADDIRFIALARTIRTSAMQIESLKLNGQNFYTLRHREGKFNLIIHFTGFYELLTAIKEANPTFETKGI